MKKMRCSLICLSLMIMIFGCAGKVPAETSVTEEGNPETVITKTNTPEAAATQEALDYNVLEIDVPRGDYTIYGKLFLPAGETELPLVILSHGFGGSHLYTEEYAEYFAENGIASFAFDFVGGGSASRSGGSTTEMSVLTEAADLGAVVDFFMDYSEIDRQRIFLFGESQGGFVSTYVAGTRPEAIAGLIALYPAFVLQDDSRQRNPDPETGPETSNMMGVTIGMIYDVDAQSFDIYDIMAGYTGKTLLIHGTADQIVPLSYSEKAESRFQDAKLITIDGAGHGFYGEDMEEAAQLSFSFIQDILGQAAGDPAEQSSGEEADADMEMKLLIGNTPVEVSWEENASTEALKELITISPLKIQMSMYGGFEQVGSVGTSLPRDDVQMTTSAGDIVLYSGNQIVVFYGSNSWAYTRLGKITGKSAADLEGLLGNGDVTITIFTE